MTFTTNLNYKFGYLIVSLGFPGQKYFDSFLLTVLVHQEAYELVQRLKHLAVFASLRIA